MTDQLSKEEFENSTYGRLDKELGGRAYKDPFVPEMVPPGGRIVPDPKDGVFGIIVGKDGRPIVKTRIK